MATVLLSDDSRQAAADWHDGMSSALYLANCAGTLPARSDCGPDASDALREIGAALRDVLRAPDCYTPAEVARLGLLAVDIGEELLPEEG